MFRYDGKLFQTLSKIGDIIILNFFWILGCLPVVTICTSTSALYYCCIKCVRRDRSKISTEFWRAYKMNLKQGIPCTILLAVLIYLLLIYYQFCGTYMQTFSGTTRDLMFFLGLVVYSLLLGSFVPTLCPTLSRFSLPFGKFLELTFFMGLRHILRTFLVGAVIVLTFFLALGNFMIFFIGPAAIAFGSTFIYEPIFWKYMPRDQAENGDNWYFEGEEDRKRKKQEQGRRDSLFRSKKQK